MKNTKLVKIVGILIVSVGILGAIGDSINTAPKNSPTSSTAKQSYEAEIKTETRREPTLTTTEERNSIVVPFQTTETSDNTLASGSTRVWTEGVNGESVEIYRVTFIDGVESSRELIRTEVVREPVTKVVAHGTYVAPAQNYTSCTNGTYVNTAGNTVCRPSTTDTGGATAICNDGTYSYSQSRRGTCSGHGGVSRWL